MSRESIQRAYARWSAQYDQDANRTRDTALAALGELLPALGERDVLELGAGTGQSTARLLGARSLVALDFSEAMLERAKAKMGDVTRVRFICHDVCEPWPFAAASFDLVTESLVLEHTADLKPVFTEAHRVLRTGGSLLIFELHPYRQLAGRQARFEAGGETVLVPAFTHSISEFVTTALEVGFAVEHLGEWGEPGAVPRVLSLLLRNG